jgi:hypothetical protein
VLAFWSKSLVFHGESAGWRKWQHFFKGKVLDGLKSRASRGEAPPFPIVGFLGKVFGCVWYPMEKLLDVSRGTRSLENRPPMSKYCGIVKEFGISWGARWVTQTAFFCKGKLLP